jgi:hypothetical protein
LLSEAPVIEEPTSKKGFSLSSILNAVKNKGNASEPNSKVSFLDVIKARRNDSDVVDGSVKESNINTITDSSKIVEEAIKPDIVISAPESTNIPVENKSTFNNLFDQIKSRRLETSPKISQVGLGTSESPQLLSPLKTKTSITNLFDDTSALFDDIDDKEPAVVENILPADH